MQTESGTADATASIPNPRGQLVVSPVRVPYSTIGTYFLLSRGLIFLVAWLSLNVVEKGKYFPGKQNSIDWFNRWDCSWYLDIAQHGYRFLQGGKDSNTGFFPLYPCLIRLFSFFGVEPRIGGYLLSNLALLGS